MKPKIAQFYDIHGVLVGFLIQTCPHFDKEHYLRFCRNIQNDLKVGPAYESGPLQLGRLVYFYFYQYKVSKIINVFVGKLNTFIIYFFF